MKPVLESSISQFESVHNAEGCVKHEMRKLKVQVEDNIAIANRVDILEEKMKKIEIKRFTVDDIYGVVPDWSVNMKGFFTAIYTFFAL